MEEKIYSIKMRASSKERHISGAEKITDENHLQKYCTQLLERALKHAKGSPDTINIKIEEIHSSEIKYLDALPVTTCETATPEEGFRKIREFLQKLKIKQKDSILEKLKETYNMRGAMLLDVNSLNRLEPNLERGIRATYMDMANETDDKSAKNHFKEALVLATKVCNHPNILGEICISDDPDYVTGYFASKECGYIRITKLKEYGDPNGGRIFLFQGSPAEAKDCIQYIEKQKILVRINGVIKARNQWSK